MKNRVLKNPIVFAIIILFLLQGCSPKKTIISDIPSNEIELSEIIKNSRKADLKFENLRNKVKVEFNDGKSIQTINLSLRALENELLWMSATMIVPIAKILLTNQKILFYEKFQKTYINQDLDLIMRTLGIKNPVEIFQNILFGNPILDTGKADWVMVENSNYYVLKSSKSVQSTLFINPETFKLEQQRIYLPFLSSLITINYSNYKILEGKIFPNNVLISYIKGSEIIKINLEYSQFDFPEKLTFPMEIPTDYKIKTLDEILK
jgi:hypothetical protein